MHIYIFVYTYVYVYIHIYIYINTLLVVEYGITNSANRFILMFRLLMCVVVDVDDRVSVTRININDISIIPMANRVC